ncbi:type II toxin-antitoxin system PrlF family antitoxin [Alcaligenaceae bacterium CGII-47]|nr:type II toxin-antitoxin system PrlF family antitoxin [Alcaligenaceae bacterium CGII-47]
MPTIYELATITSKGQITLPKSIRQTLGVDVGDKVAFDLNEHGQIMVSRAESKHEDPAIGAFLDLLAEDVQAGLNLGSLPADLAQSMLRRAARAGVLGEEIEGNVAL